MAFTLRPDQQHMASLITPGSRVMDIGCGEGQLLGFLTEEKRIIGHGIELEPSRVSQAVQKGLAVIQGDADHDLIHYPSYNLDENKGFDVSILSLTLQVMQQPRSVLESALRIARHTIVTIPNFGHIHNRLYLMLRGKMPVTRQLSYAWYETPNIHFCTIKDFISLTQEIGCTIQASYWLNRTGRLRRFHPNRHLQANLLAEKGIFVLSNEAQT